jgi:hypothetical protein
VVLTAALNSGAGTRALTQTLLALPGVVAVSAAGTLITLSLDPSAPIRDLLVVERALARDRSLREVTPPS